jgi:DNA-binding transcriptional ArsR family regulator
MSVPIPPEGGSFPRRPQRSPPAPSEAPKANGTPPLAPMTSVDRRVLLAIEELAAARRAAGLQPGRYSTESPVESTPETDAKEARVAAYMADVDAALWGAYPEPLPDLTPPLEPDAFLVGGFIRPGTTVMLTGPPGSSKSWAARQLAMACAAGLESFLDTYSIERPLNVLLIDEDNGPDEEWRRDETLLAHLGLHRNQLGRLRRLSLGGVQFDQERWQQWLRGNIHLLDIDLVIADPISEMHGGKELRDDPGFRSMLGFLKRLKVDFPRLATLQVHHTRKEMAGDRTKDRSLDYVRGQWGQTPDVVALMWGLGERRVAWELHKRVPRSKLILEASPSGPIVKVADETTSSSQRMETDGRVMAALAAGAEQADEIVTATGLSRRGVYKVLSRLAEAGLVTAKKPYRLVEDREIQGVEGD